MTDLSFNITYYNEPLWLEWWYNTFSLLRDTGIDIKLNIVDDGSQDRPATAFFEKHEPIDTFHLFRVTKDYGFNSHGCRNLLMQQTQTDWNVLTDIDIQFDIDVIQEVLASEKNKGEYYMFFGVRERAPRVNCFTVHREDFKKSGGYDEEFVNYHFGDRLFFHTSLDPVCKCIVKNDWWCHTKRSKRNITSADIETTQYPNDRQLVVPLTYKWSDQSYTKSVVDYVCERNKDPIKRMNKPTINFEWEQVF